MGTAASPLIEYLLCSQTGRSIAKPGTDSSKAGSAFIYCS
jgi:hypothetical protein